MSDFVLAVVAGFIAAASWLPIIWKAFDLYYGRDNTPDLMCWLYPRPVNRLVCHLVGHCPG